MLSNQYVRMAVATIAIATAILLPTNSSFYSAAVVSAFFSASVFAATIVLLMVRPSRTELMVAVAVTAVLLIADYWLLRYTRALVAPITFIGFGSLCALAIGGLFADDGHRRTQRFLGFFGCLGFVVSTYMADSFHHITEVFHPNVLDLRLNSFDASLGIQPAFAVGQLFARSPNLRVTSLIFYILLSVPIALVFGGWLRRDLPLAKRVVIGFLIVGPIGIIFYNLLPALGPIHIFRRNFPFNPMPPETAREMLNPVRAPGPRNAIPSLHFAWVVLAFWLSRGLPSAIRVICALFVAFTFLATLGTGEHYLIDLVVAIPYAMLIEALIDFRPGDRDWTRRLLLPFAMILTWFALLSFATSVFWISPAVPWLLMLLTIAAVAWARRYFARAKAV
jgi:hypothetical protein